MEEQTVPDQKKFPVQEKPLAIPVAWRDILPWTKVACRSCEGRGVITRLTQVEAGFWEQKPAFGPSAPAGRIRHPAKAKKRTTLCGCAVKRFRKVQDCTVVNGQLFAVEPWVAVHPETVAEVVEHMEKEEAAKAAALAVAKADPEVDTGKVEAVEEKKGE